MPKPAELIQRARIIGHEREQQARRASNASLADRIAQKRRIIAKAAEMGITLHPSHAETLARLEAEAAAPRETPELVRAREEPGATSQNLPTRAHGERRAG